MYTEESAELVRRELMPEPEYVFVVCVCVGGGGGIMAALLGLPQSGKRNLGAQRVRGEERVGRGPLALLHK